MLDGKGDPRERARNDQRKGGELGREKEHRKEEMGILTNEADDDDDAVGDDDALEVPEDLCRCYCR